MEVEAVAALDAVEANSLAAAVVTLADDVVPQDPRL